MFDDDAGYEYSGDDGADYPYGVNWEHAQVSRYDGPDTEDDSDERD